MLNDVNIAFYAPINPPDHHIPSGDRLIAQNLMKALEITGANVELASRYIAYSKRHDASILEDRKQGALDEALRLVMHYKSFSENDRPAIWVTYHPYCKAPDWIGPIVSNALGIPYVTIEAARTGQGGNQDLWKSWREEAQAGIKSADCHLVFKPTDKAYLSSLLGSDKSLHDFSPFVDAESIALAEPASLSAHWDKNIPVIITTGMMRKGKKVDNFEILARVLSGMEANFNLIVVGGGPEEAYVKSAFSNLGAEQIFWTGIVDHGQVLQLMAGSDVFIWPGWKEPIGMVYLEAQLQELPVIAFESMGVPLVVSHKETGLLAPEDDIDAMQKNLTKLFNDQTLAKRMGAYGRKKVLANHGIQSAANRLSDVLGSLL